MTRLYRRHRALGVVAVLAAVASAVVPALVAPSSLPRAQAASCPAAGGSVVPTLPAPAGSQVAVYGHGYGHSMGLSQYGAQGAARLGCSATQILTTYYPGTHVAASASLGTTVMLGLLSNDAHGHADVGALSGTLTWSAAGAVTVKQATGQTWHVVRSAKGGADVQDGTGKVVLHAGVDVEVRAGEGSALPVANIARVRTFGGSAGTTVVADLQLKWDYTSIFGGPNGMTVRQVIVPTGSVSGVEKYLWGLAEVPVSWPSAALQAQAVAARTYLAYASWNAALHAYLIGTTTASQNYGGYAKEVEDAHYATPPPWHTAVLDTAAWVVLDSANHPIDALYGSTAGGRTEDVRYVWGSTGYPYLASVDDSTWELASDDPSSKRSWVRGFSRAQVAAALGLTTVTSVSVGAPGTTARLSGVVVTGTVGTTAVTRTYDGWAFKGALGLLSPGFTFTPPPLPDTAAPTAQAVAGPAGFFHWGANDPAPSSGIAGYDVTVQHGATVDWTATGTTATSHTIVGVPGTGYQLTVVAHDRAGHASAAATSTATVAMPGTYVAVGPVRVVDTRLDLGATGPVGARRAVAVPLSGAQGIPSGVTAVVANVTVTSPAVNGYIGVGDGSTGTTALTFGAHQTVGQLAVLPVDAAGRVALLNGSVGTVQLVVDVQGYLLPGTTGGRLTTLAAPARVVDTRLGRAVHGPLAAGTAAAMVLAGGSGTPVPSGVTAVVAQVTAVDATQPGWLAVGAGGSGTSNVNYVAGRPTGNLVVVPVDGTGTAHLFNGGPVPVDLLVDVLGYVGSGTAGTYDPSAWARLVDTRTGAGLAAGLHGLAATSVAVTGVAGTPVPAGAAAVLVSVTETAATTDGWLGAGDGSSSTSFLNFTPTTTVTGTVLLPLDPSGHVTVYNGGSGTVQVVLDVQGYVD